MTEKPDALLREMVELLADRPFQALDRHGPFVCMFCGEMSSQEDEPHHEPGCVWPRVLEAVGWHDGGRPPPRRSRIGRPANEG